MKYTTWRDYVIKGELDAIRWLLDQDDLAIRFVDTGKMQVYKCLCTNVDYKIGPKPKDRKHTCTKCEREAEY